MGNIIGNFFVGLYIGLLVWGPCACLILSFVDSWKDTLMLYSFLIFPLFGIFGICFGPEEVNLPAILQQPQPQIEEEPIKQEVPKAKYRSLDDEWD